MRHRTVAVGAVLLLFSSALGAAAEPDVLVGSWSLNPDASDDPEEAFRMWIQRRVSSGDASAAGGPGGGGAGAGGFAGARGLMEMMQSFSAGSELLKITYAAPELTIVRANGAANMVFTDDRVVESEDGDGGVTKVRTRWKKDRLTVSITLPVYASDGTTISPSVTMAYRIGKEGRLELTTTVGVGGRVPPFSLERIYDPVDG